MYVFVDYMQVQESFSVDHVILMGVCVFVRREIFVGLEHEVQYVI